MENMPQTNTNAVANYVRALRLPFITASVLPFILGSLVNKGRFDLFNFAAGLICVAATHLSANLINDYGDSKSGADWIDRRFYGFFGGSKLIQEDVLSENFYLKSSLLFAAAAAVSAILLAIRLKAPIIILLYAVIITLALSYSVKPLQLSYHRLGEAIIFVLFGPAIVMGGSFLQTKTIFTLESFLLSFPLGFLTTAILYANEVPDFANDTKAGKHTWVGIVGAERAYILYYILTFLAFFFIALNMIMGYLKITAFLLFIFIILAVKAAKILKSYPHDKTKLLESSKLTILLQGLVGISLILVKAL